MKGSDISSDTIGSDRHIPTRTTGKSTQTVNGLVLILHQLFWPGYSDIPAILVLAILAQLF